MNTATGDDSWWDQLIWAKHAKEIGMYTKEDYERVTRASSMVLALRIGIQGGVIFSHVDMQAAFFLSLGIPGRPTEYWTPVDQAMQEAEASTVTQPIVEHRRSRRRTRAGRYQDGLDEDRHP